MVVHSLCMNTVDFCVEILRFKILPPNSTANCMLHRCEARRQCTCAHKNRKQLSFDGKVPTTRTRVDAETKQSNASELSNLSTVALLDCCVCAFFKHFTKFLQRCARKCIFFNMPMALNVFHMNCCYNISCRFTNSLDGCTSNLNYPPRQRLCRSPEYNSKVPLMHASNYRQKANVQRVRMDLSGLGTYHMSPT